MKTKTTTDSLILPKNKKQWKLYQQLGKFASDLNRLPDAEQLKTNRPKSAPIEQLPMVF
ncbi:hypothetical protein ACMDB5_09805 [Flavobacterium sp. W1B]|uniref:hypothetical protein n=1 Tax=Flavobacterium sp. W1B TaxID=3394146 RepID=UPI0039BD4BA6